MVSKASICGLVLLSELLVSSPASAQTSDPVRICALLQDVAGVPAETLDRAKHEAVRVFERSGLGLTWVTGGAAFGPHCLTVRIAPKPLGSHDREPRTLGMASGTRSVRGNFAWVFYHRIRLASSQLEIDESLLLGHVIAHEIGHLFLPYGKHAVSGVMRAAWDRAQAMNAAAGFLTFTPSQVSFMRRLLSP
jgi:hypothetical protein